MPALEPSLHQFVIYSPSGERLPDLSGIKSFTAALRTNEVGTLTLDDVPDDYWPILSRPDTRIEYYRSIDGGRTYRLFGDKQFLVRVAGPRTEQNVFKLAARCSNTLLNRRHVLYAAGSSQAEKSAVAADNLIKAVMRENFGSSAAAITSGIARNISAYLAIQPDTSQGPVISKAFAYRKVLDVLREIAQASFVAGTYLAFDVVQPVPGGTQWEFRTYTGQRGADHRFPNGTGGPLIFSPELGNLAEVQYTLDYESEANYIYAAGQGQEDQRVVAQSYDSARISQSPVGLIESYRDARQSSTLAAVQDEADAYLRESRPRRIFSARLVDSEVARFGREYDYGDRITANFRGEQIDCILDAVQITFDSSGEKIDARVQSVD